MAPRLLATGLALLAALSFVAHPAHAADCSVDVNSADIPKNQPVLLTPTSSQQYSSFLKPNSKGMLQVSQGKRMTVACSGTSFLILKEAANSVETSCVGDTLFQLDGGPAYTLNALACSSTVTPTLRFTGASCGARNRFSIAEVGFTIGAGFYQLYDICFSNNSLSAAYAHHTISAGIAGAQNLSDTSQWVDGSVYGKVDVTEAYNLQNITLEELGINTSTYLTDEMYLERGALAPAADFLLGSHQAAAYFGVNSAPRWSQVGSGNWAKLEGTLRSVATIRGRDLDVYTGTHGVLALPNSEDVAIQIYLDQQSSQKKYLPVPRYLWKIVYEPLSGIGAAFITVNNPFINKTQLEAQYRLCPDICEKIEWLTWDQSDNEAGMSYCCDYLEFKKRVPNAPDIEIKTYTSSAQVVVSSMWLPCIFTTVAAIRVKIFGI